MPIISNSKFILALAAMSRRIWRLKGWNRLLRVMYTPDRYPKKDRFCAVFPYDDNLLINIDTSNFIEWSIFFKGHYETYLVQLYKRILKPGMVVIDVGANVGCHTLIFSDRVTDRGHVIAVEPNLEVAQRLMENCQLNQIQNVRLFRVACAYQAQASRTLVVSDTSNKTGHLSPATGAPNEFGSVRNFSVEVSTLNDIFAQSGHSRLDFVKIDVDGGEYDVLLGGEATFVRYHPHILFEYSPSDYSRSGIEIDIVRECLERWGYNLYFIHDFREYFSHLTLISTGMVPGGNLLAIPNDGNPNL